jgi:hypothetical protein
MVEAINNIPGVGAISGAIGSIGGFLGFDVGGVVPGPIGAPQLAIVHGGETIVPTHDPGAMRRMADDYESAGPAPVAGGGDTYVYVDMTGAIVASQAEADRFVADAWNRAVRTTGRVNIIPSAVRR